MDSAAAVHVLQWVVAIFGAIVGVLLTYRGRRLMGAALATIGLVQIVPSRVVRLVLCVVAIILIVVQGYLSRPQVPKSS